MPSDDADGTVLTDAVRWIQQASGPAVTPTPTATNTPTATLTPVEIIIDNADPGFELAGSWTNYTGTIYPRYGPDAYYSDAGTGSDTATFRPDIPESGQYEIFTWYGTYGPGATNVPFSINHDDGSTTMLVRHHEPNYQSGSWLSLGVYTLSAGTASSDQISDDADGYVMADAIRWV